MYELEAPEDFLYRRHNLLDTSAVCVAFRGKHLEFSLY